MNLREALQAVSDARWLTPEAVVEEARLQKTDAGLFLYDRLEWDDSKAGEQFRRRQAAAMIRSVKVVYREATETESARVTRAFVSVRRPEGNVYQSSADVADDPFAAALVLRDMERQWKALRRAYGRFAEFTEMIRGDLGDENERATG